MIRSDSLATVRFVVEALLEHRAAEAIGEIRDMVQLARLEHHIAPRIYLHHSRGVLPERFTCPECGGRLDFDIDDWEVDGQPIWISIYCAAEQDAAYEDVDDEIHEGYTDWPAWQELGEHATSWARKWLRRPL